MAAKKVSSSTPVDQAIAAIKRRYPGTSMGEFKGVRSTAQAVQQFQGVVAESALTDKFNNRTLMAAAAKVATQRFSAYGGGSEDARKMRAAGKPAASKMSMMPGVGPAKKKMK
jgi:hypothetical protein